MSLERDSLPAAAGLFVLGLGMKDRDRTDEVGSVIMAFRCSKDLIGAIEQQAAVEGISKSDVTRRAVMRDLRRAKMQEVEG